MIIRMKYTIFISILLVSIFSVFNPLHSQELGVTETVNFEMVPEVPKAGEQVGVFLNSFVTNIDLCNITWKLNGKVIKSGIGEKKFEFTMGKDGTVTSLEVSVKTPEGATYSKNYSLKPTSVDMILESDGVVPPFYKGKNIFTHQNQLTIVAVPHIIGNNGAEINPKTLVYKWKKNGSVIESALGYGKNTYTFEGSLISRPMNISVEITSDQGVGYGSIYITPSDPFILFYKKDPIYGIQFQKALEASEPLNNSKEITILATPYFIDLGGYVSNSLMYKWAINGKQIQDDGQRKFQTFRQNEGSSGTANISLSVENPDKILQFAQKSLMLSFTNK